MSTSSRGRPLVRLGIVIAAAFACLGLVLPSTPAQASAPVILSGSSWFDGQGVNVCSSSTDPYCGSEAHVGGWSGNWWQCVELAQRFYKRHGWHSGIFAGVSYAYQIYDKAPSLDMSRQANGSISSIVPGDMIVHSSSFPGSGGAGHVAIVDSVNGSTINAVEQNASSTGRATYTLSGGSLSRGSVLGVVHDPQNTGGSSSSPSSDTGRGTDFDGDGKSDIFWFGEGGDPDEIWYGSSARSSFGAQFPTKYGNYIPVAGDFNGDGRDDVFWYGPGSGQDEVWYGAPTQGAFEARFPSKYGSYTPFAGDFNGDGMDDVFWYGPGSAGDEIWYGATTKGVFEARALSKDGVYTPIPGDFDGDGIDDVFWYGPGSAADEIWYGTTTKGAFGAHFPSKHGVYEPFAGDFDGDGIDDVFWYGPGSAADEIWYGTTTRGLFGAHFPSKYGTYTPIPGDYDGDGYDDIMWYGVGSNQDELWYGTPARGAFASHQPSKYGVYVPVREH